VLQLGEPRLPNLVDDDGDLSRNDEIYVPVVSYIVALDVQLLIVRTLLPY
jgi:hypothetical protein